MKFKKIYEELTVKDFEEVTKQADQRAISVIIQSVLRHKPFEKACKEYKKKWRSGMDEKRWQKEIVQVAYNRLKKEFKLTSSEIESGTW